MQVPSLDPPLLTAGPAPTQAPAVALLLHGRGSSAEEMIHLASRLELSAIAYLAAGAPGGTWYPESFLAPVEKNQPHLDRALGRIDGIVRGLERAGQPRRRIAFVGFSQGACLAAEYVFRHPVRWGGLAAIIGGLIGPRGTAWSTSASLECTPVLLATADPDPWVPAERVHETANVFRAMHANVDMRIRAGVDHTFCDDSVAATRALLAQLLA